MRFFNMGSSLLRWCFAEHFNASPHFILLIYWLFHFSRYQLAREKASEIHRKLEAAVDESVKLKQLATKAFISFVRSYATYPMSLKHIFHIRNLHLGHVAKSFALQVSLLQNRFLIPLQHCYWYFFNQKEDTNCKKYPTETELRTFSHSYDVRNLIHNEDVRLYARSRHERFL